MFLPCCLCASRNNGGCLQVKALWSPFRAYLIHMDVVVVITVIYGFDEALELPYSTAVNHQNKSHSDRVLHFRQAVVQLTNSLDLI